MRVELHKGRHLLCGGVIPSERIDVGQVWVGSSGATVRVCEIRPRGEDVLVSYDWFEGVDRKTHTKDCFSFQCRYCLVLPDENLPDWAKDL